ncbi:MAG: hypothetical protein ACI8Q6_004062 [Granulosicoccus sp.]|jgi:hypothetical protein
MPSHLVEIAAGAFSKMTDAQCNLSRPAVANPIAHRFEFGSGQLPRIRHPERQCSDPN